MKIQTYLRLRNLKIPISIAPFRYLLLASTVCLSALNAAIAAPPAENFIGIWTGNGKLMFKGEYRVKLTLKDDNTCVLEYSDREPPHNLNPYPRTGSIVVTGPWRFEKDQWRGHILIDGKISEWTEVLSPPGEKPSTYTIKSKPFEEPIDLHVQPDGSLLNAMITFKGEFLGLPKSIQATGVTLTKQVNQ